MAWIFSSILDYLNKGDMEVKESVRKDALQRIREHISDANICMITNNIMEWSLQPESLSNQRLDKSGNIWFLYFQPSIENSLLSDGKMEVFYSNRLKSKFLSLVGEISWASVSEIEDMDDISFSRESFSGISTPFRVARFFPLEAFVWDDIVKDMVPLSLFDSQNNDDKLVA